MHLEMPVVACCRHRVAVPGLQASPSKGQSTFASSTPDIFCKYTKLGQYTKVKVFYHSSRSNEHITYAAWSLFSCSCPTRSIEANRVVPHPNLTIQIQLDVLEGIL